MRKPEACRGCPGFNWSDGTDFTLNEGTGKVTLAVFAEAPGEHEAEENRPLSPNGASGKVFRRALRELGIPVSAITVSNVIRCRVPGNELRGMPYEREALDHCGVHLRRTLEEAGPTVILALGDVPLRELAAERLGSVTAMRGFLLDSKWAGVKLVSTYHPSYIARGAWQLYGAFKHDISFAFRCALRGLPTQLETTYQLQPSVEDVGSYIRFLLDSPTLPVSYDIETPHILGEEEPDDWRQKRIIQIQFSHTAGQAIVLPWDNGEYRDLARRILALPNPKWGWNSRLSDDLALRANGCELGGELHDLMNAWGHLQPSYWGGKDDRDTDKGVPSRLMGLQSCSSFYCPEMGPYKGIVERALAEAGGQVTEEVLRVLRYYGGRDADVTTRCGEGIMASLTAQGLMEGYRTHKLDQRPVLDYLGEIGLPVDRAAQAELRTYVTAELTRLQTEIQGLVPDDMTGTHPKAGYKNLAGKACYASDPTVKTPLRAIIEQQQMSEPQLVIAAKQIGYLVERNFDGETRWCIQRLFNPHGSSPNTKAYIRFMGYRMPRALDSGEETTGKLELQKLAAETGDDVLRLIGEWREFAQIANNYSGGHWIPEEDGRVHAEFKWGTASAQLVAVRPPVMTYPEHSELAKRVKEVIRAQPGHMLVKIDKRGYHARMTGWLARDPVYYRIANFDVHSFVTAGFLNLHDAPYLMDMADDELAGSLAAIKHEHGHTRNYKVKRVVHGVTFGARVNKIYGMYGPNFDPSPETMIAQVGESRWYDWDRERQMRETARRGRAIAQALIDTLGHQFPRTFIVFPEWVRNQIYNVTKCRLVSPFGHHRLFWNFDMEQATAFLPSNCSHCDFQAALVRMYRARVLHTFEAINSTHDALWMHPEFELVEDGIAAMQEEFDKPSTILVDNPLGPFQCNSDAEIGPDLAHMVDVGLWRSKGKPTADDWANVNWRE